MGMQLHLPPAGGARPLVDVRNGGVLHIHKVGSSGSEACRHAIPGSVVLAGRRLEWLPSRCTTRAEKTKSVQVGLAWGVSAHLPPRGSGWRAGGVGVDVGVDRVTPPVLSAGRLASAQRDEQDDGG